VAFGDGPPKQVTLKIGAPPEIPVKDEEMEMEAAEKTRKK
jgi:hypothetical protein